MIVVVLVGCVISILSGTFTKIYEGDPSMLSFVIMGFAVYASARIGLLTWKFGRLRENAPQHELVKIDIDKESGWLASTKCSRIGLLGTMAGFIIALGGLSNLVLNDPVSMQGVITSMAKGVNIALYTTLVGQLCNIILSAQTFNLSQALQHRFNDNENR